MLDLLAFQIFSVSAFDLPMAGLEPARANYGPTDFKSVASAISPHRRADAAILRTPSAEPKRLFPQSMKPACQIR
jgi:hypothetical protein